MLRLLQPAPASALAALFVLLAAAAAEGAEASSSDAQLTGAAETPDHDKRRFSGLGFHAHMEIGPAYGQQVITVERIDSNTTLDGEPDVADGVAHGFGLATRLELWPAYGRHGGAGIFGEGTLGGARREGGGAAVFTGSTGVLVMAGAPRFRVMAALGRSRRAGALGSGTDITLEGTSLAEGSSYTAGYEDVSSYRAGFGVRTVFDREDRRGLDAWLLFDEPVGDGAVIGVPALYDASIAMRATLWLRNTLVVSGEVSLRGSELDSPVNGTRVSERSASLMIGWSMDRFSRPYGPRS